MANVNLISARRAERLRLTRVARVLVGTVIVSIALSVFLSAYMTMSIVMGKRDIERMQGELDRLKPALQEIEGIERERQALLPKLSTLSDAQTRTRQWWSILDGLKRAIPEQTWLTNLAVEGTEEDPTIRLSGVTSNQARVGETMMRLTAQPEHYQKVDWRYTQATLIEGTPTVEFEVTAELAPLKPEPPAAPKGDADAPKSN